MTKVVIDTNVLVSSLLNEHGPCAAVLSAIAGELVHPTAPLNISPDEADNRFYECAEASGADYLVTGNRKDFPKSHKTTKVVTPRQLFQLLEAGQA